MFIGFNVLIFIFSASAIQLTVQKNSWKCLGHGVEESQPHVTFRISRLIEENKRGTKAIKAKKAQYLVEIRDPKGQPIFPKSAVHILPEETEFVLSDPKEFGTYEICFRYQTAERNSPFYQSFQLSVDSKNPERQREIKNLGPMEGSIEELETRLETIDKYFDYLHKRELRMAQTSETTSSRIQTFKMLSFLLLLTTTCCQIYYLKQFFLKKKII